MRLSGQGEAYRAGVRRILGCRRRSCGLPRGQRQFASMYTFSAGAPGAAARCETQVIKLIVARKRPSIKIDSHLPSNLIAKIQNNSRPLSATEGTLKPFFL